MGEDLLYELKGPVAFLTINRESRRNAISQEMILGFLENLQAAEKKSEVRAVCITGTGDRAFCSGADLAITLAGEGLNRLEGARNYARLMKMMSRFGKPLVARVNGPCLAGGLGIMLSCEIVIARNDSYFCTPEVNVGIFPMMIGALLYRNVGRKKAMDMVLTARKVQAREAEAMGLVTRAVAPENLDKEIHDTLDLLAGRSPIGMRIGKEAFRAMSDMSLDDAIDYLCGALGKVISTEDAMEGMMAFMEKRKPDFKGK
jgi:enoyl-CoA hydratase/carnithine racemase